MKKQEINTTLNISTGNSIVDAVGKMNFSGNVIPESWYHTIKDSKGKVNFLAILILADIVYWYRPVEVRDEQNNLVTYKKKFKADDFLQKNYKQICEKFNVSEAQSRNAIILLESLGVIKRHFRTIDTSIGKCSNVMFLELFPAALLKLTFPSKPLKNNENQDEEMSNEENIDGCCKKNQQQEQNTDPTLSRSSISCYEKKEENTTNFDCVHNLLSRFKLDNAEIVKIIIASDGNIEKIRQAVNALNNCRTPVNNIVGFLIAALKQNYSSSSKKWNNFINYSNKQDYDFNELELLLCENY